MSLEAFKAGTGPYHENSRIPIAVARREVSLSGLPVRLLRERNNGNRAVAALLGLNVTITNSWFMGLDTKGNPAVIVASFQAALYR